MNKPPPPASPEPGTTDPVHGVATTIGKYRLLRRIGEGGMGTVYEAEQWTDQTTGWGFCVPENPAGPWR